MPNKESRIDWEKSEIYNVKTHWIGGGDVEVRIGKKSWIFTQEEFEQMLNFKLAQREESNAKSRGL